MGAHRHPQGPSESAALLWPAPLLTPPVAAPTTAKGSKGGAPPDVQPQRLCPWTPTTLHSRCPTCLSPHRRLCPGHPRNAQVLPILQAGLPQEAPSVAPDLGHSCLPSSPQPPPPVPLPKGDLAVLPQFLPKAGSKLDMGQYFPRPQPKAWYQYPSSGGRWAYPRPIQKFTAPGTPQV